MNRVESDFLYNGLRCVVIRTRMGHRCGYVGVPVGSRFYGVKYLDILHIPSLEEYIEDKPCDKMSPMSVFLAAGSIKPDKGEADLVSLINVHGSITYTEGDDDYPVESEGMWWIGFDATHYEDDRSNGGRPLEYMEGECRSLVDQLIAFPEFKKIGE